MNNRKELDLKLAHLKEYRDALDSSLPPGDSIPRRGIGTYQHNPTPLRPASTKMDVLQWVKVVLLSAAIAILARFVASTLGWESVSIIIGYVGMSIISLGTVAALTVLIRLRITELRSAKPRRGMHNAK